MSGWEKVTSSRNNRKGENLKVNGSKKKDRIVNPTITPDQILTMQSLQSALDPISNSIKEVGDAKGSQAQNLNNKSKEEEKKRKKKQEKNDKTEQKEKKSEKAVKFREAAKLIKVQDLKNVLSSVKSLYPGNQVLWMRDAATFLNLNLICEEKIDLDSTKIFSDEPLSYLSKDLKKVLTGLFEECSDKSRQGSYETLLANMVHDLAGGLSINGYIVTLQHLSKLYPELCVSNMERFQELKNSYQNRANVCIPMLWILGQGGQKNTSHGLRLWLELMLPMLTMKHYTKFVINYLASLLKIQSDSKDKNRILYSTQFFKIFDAMFITAPGSVSKPLEQEFLSSYDQVKEFSIGDCSHDHELFPEFMRRLKTALSTHTSRKNPVLIDELLSCLSDCLTNNPAAIKHWQQMYISYLPSSFELLHYLDSNWDSYGVKIKRNEAFKETFQAFLEHNKANASDEVYEACLTIKSLLTKMSNRGSKSGWFPWKFATIGLIFLIYLVVKNDTERSGSFEKSRVGFFLKDVGAYHHTVNTYSMIRKKSIETSHWLETNGPVYYNNTMEAVQPYWSMAKTGCSTLLVKINFYGGIVIDTLEQYCPGLKNNLSYASKEVGRMWNSFLVWAPVKMKGVGNEVADKTLKSAAVVSKFSDDFLNGKIKFSDVKAFAQRTYVTSSDAIVHWYRWAYDEANKLMK